MLKAAATASSLRFYYNIFMLTLQEIYYIIIDEKQPFINYSLDIIKIYSIITNKRFLSMRGDFMYTIYLSDNETPNTYKYNEWHNIYCPSHCHSSLEIVIVLSGVLNAEKEGKPYTLKENDMLVVMPFETHNFTTTDGSHIAVLEISTGIISSFDIIFKNKTPENPCCSLSGDELALFFDHLKSVDSSSMIELNFIVFMCFSIIMKNTKLKAYSEPDNYFKKAILYVNTHYEENICLKDVAKAININHIYLSRLFAKNNLRFNDFINSFRIRKANQLLKASDLSISEIAFNCGFGSIRNFNRIFLKHMNCTPNDYRKMYQSSFSANRKYFI